VDGGELGTLDYWVREYRKKHQVAEVMAGLTK